MGSPLRIMVGDLERPFPTVSSSPANQANNTHMQTTTPIQSPKLISFNKFLEQLGVTATTGWRWRKRGIIKPVNIYGRLYLSEDSMNEFHRRATAGEFATESALSKRSVRN